MESVTYVEPNVVYSHLNAQQGTQCPQSEKRPVPRSCSIRSTALAGQSIRACCPLLRRFPNRLSRTPRRSSVIPRWFRIFSKKRLRLCLKRSKPRRNLANLQSGTCEPTYSALLCAASHRRGANKSHRRPAASYSMNGKERLARLRVSK